MCGIAGCLALALEADPDQNWVSGALERITHRGPDDDGMYADQDVCLGFRRLAILDLSQAGHQPMKSADGRYWMIFNGEIYNYLELGQELRDQGVALRSSGDAEVLLEAYALVGKEIVHRLRGMYAFAIWDTWTRELFCARDPFGIKPFYYRIERAPGTAPNGHAGTAAGRNGLPGHGTAASHGAAPGFAANPGQDPNPGFGANPGYDAVPGFAANPGYDPDSGYDANSRFGTAPGYDSGPGAGAGHGRPPWETEAAGTGQPRPPWGTEAAGTGQPGPAWGAGAAGTGQPGPPWETGPAGAGQAGPPWETGPEAPGGQTGPPWDSLNDPPSGQFFSAPLPPEMPAQDGGSRPRGGRHAAPSSAGGDAQRAGDSPSTDWFAPTAAERQAARRPGRHAAGGPEDGNGAQPPHPQEQGGAFAAGPPPAATPAPARTPAMHQAAPGRTPDAAPGTHQGAPGTTDIRLRFASERKALAEPGELSALDEVSLRRYLAFQYVPPPDTITPPIRVLPPGHAMIARPGSEPDVYRYWRADLRPAKTASQNSAHAILAAMRDSIAVHLRSHAPLGAFLSGGIDSAAICALAAEHRPDLLTFTVGFQRDGYSEIDRAQETAAALGVRSIPYVISQEEFFYHLPQVIWHLDDPMADAAAVPLWFVAREAAKHVKVVLSGEGSDELFGGYAIYHQPGVVRAGEKLPDWGRAPIKKAAGIIPSGVKGRGFLERTSTPLRRRYIGNARVFTDLDIAKVTRPGPGTPWDVTDPVYDQAEHAGLDDVATMQLIDINTWLAGDILVKADRMTMAHSLELRVPFLDREVLSVASRLARTEKIAAGTTKLALREAMSEVLPKAAAERAKLGFPVPIGHWIKGEASGFAEQLFREAQTDQWINRQEALRLLEGYQDGEPGIEWRHVWVLIVFSLWHRIFVEKAYDPVALGWERGARVAR